MVDMKEFPEGILFRYSWRKYQKQFLDNLQDYLSDNHLHIVAPPGSGKTVLGLEIMLRINNPTLIVAPTLAIRFLLAKVGATIKVGLLIRSTIYNPRTVFP